MIWYLVIFQYEALLDIFREQLGIVLLESVQGRSLVSERTLWVENKYGTLKNKRELRTLTPHVDDHDAILV